MGDFADMALENVETIENLRLEYKLGYLSDEEAYGAGIIDEFGFMDSASSRTLLPPELPQGTHPEVICRNCKKSGLYWKEHKGNWRLFDAKGLHNCPVKPLK